MKIYATDYRLIKKFSSPYSPQTYGLVERTNRTLLGILANNCSENINNWDEYIEAIQFNYNIRYQDNIRCSHFKLLYGRKPNLLFKKINSENKREITEERIRRIQNFQNKIGAKRRKEQKK